MKKILVLSDIHYGLDACIFDFGIIRDEQPDNVVLLGDVVDNWNTDKKLIDVWKDFIDGYQRFFKLDKTVLLYGDNDTQKSKEVIEYVNRINTTINSNKVFFSLGNMSFFHGNIEKIHLMEVVGKYSASLLNKIKEEITPNLLAKLIRMKFNTKEYLFIGHIHYLNILGKNIFCGTFNSNLAIYPEEKSLGYVVVTTDDNYNLQNIEIKRI